MNSWLNGSDSTASQKTCMKQCALCFVELGAQFDRKGKSVVAHLWLHWSHGGVNLLPDGTPDHLMVIRTLVLHLSHKKTIRDSHEKKKNVSAKQLSGARVTPSITMPAFPALLVHHNWSSIASQEWRGSVRPVNPTLWITNEFFALKLFDSVSNCRHAVISKTLRFGDCLVKGWQGTWLAIL